MTGDEELPSNSLDPELRDRLTAVIPSHPIALALVFGSAVRTPEDANDLDIAVEFDGLTPADEGYSSVYLAFRSDLAEAISGDIDVVDVHAMSSRFAWNVIDHAELVYGSAERLAELTAELPLERPSVADARTRVAASADRLREGAS